MSNNIFILFCVWLLLEAIAAIISIFGNSIVICVMCCLRSLRKKSTYYIISIAIADFLSSLFVVGLTTARTLEYFELSSMLPSNACICATSVFLALTSILVLHLVFVSVDRYWAVCHPISYHTRTINFTKFTILICWISGIVFGLTTVLTYKAEKKCSIPPLQKLILASLSLSSAVIVSILYCLVFIAFRNLVRFESKNFMHK